MSLQDLKKRMSEDGNNLTTLLKQDSYQPDERFWKPAASKEGNGSAIIRFLPQPTGEASPFVVYYDHFFKGSNGWYNEKSLTTVGQDDPVSTSNKKLWETGDEAKRNLARNRKRRAHYVANVYVIKDPANPENDGQVKLYDFPKSVFDKIKQAFSPEFEDETPLNPFDLWSGADFKLKFFKQNGIRQYSKSEFIDQSVLGDDDMMTGVYDQVHSLNPFVDPSSFKTYEQLEQRFKQVTGESVAAPSQQNDVPAIVEKADIPQATDGVNDTVVEKSAKSEEDFFSDFLKKK